MQIAQGRGTLKLIFIGKQREKSTVVPSSWLQRTKAWEIPVPTSGRGCLLCEHLKNKVQNPATEIVVLKANSQMFDFPNGDSGARCYGECLLAQRGREPTQLTFPLKDKSTSPFSQSLKSTSPECPCFLLSIYLSSWLSLTLFFYVTICQLVTCSASGLWLALFSLVYNEQKTLSLKMSTRTEPHHN